MNYQIIFYSNKNYYFTLTHDTFFIKVLYHQIAFDGENIENISNIGDYEKRLAYECINYWINSLRMSCNQMYLSSKTVLTLNKFIEPEDEYLKYIKSPRTMKELKLFNKYQKMKIFILLY